MTNTTPFSTTLATLATLALAAVGAAQTGNNALLYSTQTTEESNQCATTPALNEVRPNEMEYVEPVAGPPLLYPYRGKAYLPLLGSNTVAGDVDCDAQYYEPTMFGRIDAIVHPKNDFGVNIPSNKTHVFFSPSEAFVDAGGVLLAPGDIGRLLPDVGGPGSIEHMVFEQDLKLAFGVPAADPFNVDAAAIVTDPATLEKGLMISLEETTIINVPPYGSTPVEDGAILFVPGAAITWAAAADGAQIIPLGNIAPASGWIAAREVDVDQWVQNSQISNPAGAPRGFIGDVDGLSQDPIGFGWQSNWSPFFYPHIMFCGDDAADPNPFMGLEGGGVVSTLGNGSIGVINGRPLGEVFPLPTSGEQVGLVTTPSVGALAGLSVATVRTPHFSMDTQQGVMLAPGIIDIEIGGADPFNPPPIVLWDLGANTPCGFDPGMIPVPNPDFSVLYPVTFFGSTTPVPPSGCVNVNLPIPAAVFPLLVGQALEWQAAQINLPTATYHLTNPVRTAFF